MQEFDLLYSPLEGANLIEASAGTGKTYTISALYLRFILEKGLSPEQILVVTFTEAATKELRDRIRTRLRECVDAFSIGGCEDPFLNGLISKAGDRGAASRRFADALRDFDRAAIFTIHGFCRRILHENAFESGSLFDTELVTEQEDLKREVMEDFWRKQFYTAPPEVVRYGLMEGYSPETFLSIFRANALTPDLKVVPAMTPPSLEAITRAVHGLSEAVDELARAWPAAREEVGRKLRDPGLNATTYGSTSKIDPATGRSLRDLKVDAFLRSMDGFLALKDPVLPLPDFNEFALFTAGRVARAAKKNCTPPSHPVFDVCEAVSREAERARTALDEHLLYLKIEAFRTLNEELPARKKKQNIQHFDDLLSRLRRGLEQAGGEELAEAIREKYKAALIDEFQDTDSIQYGIFHSVFQNGDRSIFLIGDPKQAIYSFRGADIFTYMEAARRADSRYTLATNWRSEPDLVHAINTLFDVPDAFVYPEISFKPVSASPRKEPEPLRIEGRTESPLQIWFLGAGATPDAGKVIKKPDAQRFIIEALTAEISNLLDLGSQGRAVMGEAGTTVRESDIAVLVRTNDEARMVQEALSRVRIPSVLYSTADLFDSAEALDLERVLSAIAEPHVEGLVRSALATDMMGVSGEELARIMEDETLWESRIVKFRDASRLWRDHGFIRMFRHLMLDEGIRTRLVTFSDGERRITNLLHLSEVLHHESIERKLGPAELLKWLSEQRDPQSRKNREHQLRLESDENAVKIITIHKSKGLEYPIVFCPFSWGGSKLRDSGAGFLFHDERDRRRPTLDLGSPERDANRAAAERELLAENMRLLYVALTRAKKRCYVAWGPFNTAETSSLAYLLHHRGRAGGPELDRDVVSETEAAFAHLDDETMLDELKEIERRSEGCIRVSTLPLSKGAAYSRTAGESPPLACRTFGGAIDRSWRISSFSSLISGTPHRAELPDRDESPAPDGPGVDEEGPFPLPPPPLSPASSVREAPVASLQYERAVENGVSSIFAFPRGARPGTFLHDVLEHLDFTEKDAQVLDELVALKLKEYGFEAAWREPVIDMIRRVLAAPLALHGGASAATACAGGEGAFSLSCIRKEERLSELEFYYPIEALAPGSLREVFQRHGGPIREQGFDPEEGPLHAHFRWVEDHLNRLTFNPVKGFMKGFIDLVFRFQGRYYLLDWKSNHLGNEVEDYNQETLAAVMDRDYYTLQYHLYTVALDRYLSVRLSDYSYDEHFGGVFYVFLRGVDPEAGPNYGVFSARPREELVRALDRLFHDGRGAGF